MINRLAMLRMSQWIMREYWIKLHIRLDAWKMSKNIYPTLYTPVQK